MGHLLLQDALSPSNSSDETIVALALGKALQPALAFDVPPTTVFQAVLLVLAALVFEDACHHLEVGLGLVLHQILVAKPALVVRRTRAIQRQALLLAATGCSDAGPLPDGESTLLVHAPVPCGPLRWRPAGDASGCRRLFGCLGLRCHAVILAGQLVDLRSHGGIFRNSNGLMPTQQEQNEERFDLH